MNSLISRLRFYFITDDGPATLPMSDQVQTALDAGATLVQYRNKSFEPCHYSELMTIQRACRRADVPLIINDHIILAKAIRADGVHVGQADDAPALARQILGPGAWIGLSVSNVAELLSSDLNACHYIGCGPVFPTGTKKDAGRACKLTGLKAVVDRTTLPVVAIGGITPANAAECLQQGAVGVAVISTITRAADPAKVARALAAACGLVPGTSH
jgi:thiamine-phosphate pyrophosphorylase